MSVPILIVDDSLTVRMDLENLLGNAWKFTAKVAAPRVGVGFATVKRMVERHGGRIWAEASPGEGATFFWTLAKEGGAPRASSGLSSETTR